MKKQILIAATLLLTSTAQAGFIEYRGSDVGAGPADVRTNSDAAAAAFDAAVGSFSLLDFESAPVGGFTSLSSASLGVAGVSLSPLGGSDGNDSEIETGGDSILGYNTTAGGTNYLDLGEFGAGEPALGVRFNFTSAINAFGGYFTGIGTSAGVTTIEFNDGSNQVLTLSNLGAGGGVEFLGFTSTIGITSVDFLLSPVAGSSNDELGLDDVRFASVASVPEPSILALLGMSLLGLGIGRRRKLAS